MNEFLLAYDSVCLEGTDEQEPLLFSGARVDCRTGGDIYAARFAACEEVGHVGVRKVPCAPK